MTTTSVQTTEEALRQAFKVLNRRLMVPLWRLGLGQWLNAWPTMSGRIMVLVHTGRKSGRRRFTPVNYAQVDGEVYCTAGFGAGSDWYKNIIANPAVEVWLPDGWWAGVAEDITGAPAALPLLRCGVGRGDSPLPPAAHQTHRSAHRPWRPWRACLGLAADHPAAASTAVTPQALR